MFRSRIPQITAEMVPALEAAMSAGAELIAARAKQRVPVATGRLRDAIHVEAEDGGFAVIAGDTEAFYGHIIEHGGARVPAHPFLIPAAEESREEVIGLVSAALRRL